MLSILHENTKSKTTSTSNWKVIKDGEARMRGALGKGDFHFIRKLRPIIVGNDAYMRKVKPDSFASLQFKKKFPALATFFFFFHENIL